MYCLPLKKYKFFKSDESKYDVNVLTFLVLNMTFEKIVLENCKRSLILSTIDILLCVLKEI